MAPRVFLSDPDSPDWACAEDRRLTRRALEGVVELSTLDACEAVHAVWWKRLEEIPSRSLEGKRILAHMPGEPHRYLARPDFGWILDRVGLWIAQSTQAAAQLRSLGIRHRLVPYTVDTRVFRRLPKDDSRLERLRRRWRIPRRGLLVGNFHRDTSPDLVTPNGMKGPDLFAEVVSEVRRRGIEVHVLLAGPRRHWIRRRLDELGIPYTFVGRAVAGDDQALNLLPRTTLNLLYNLLDLYLVTSRTEGGPHAVLEAAAAGCPLLSTRVGLAPDLLEPSALYDDALEAADRIAAPDRPARSEAEVEAHRRRVDARYRPEAVAPLFQRVYADLDAVPAVAGRRPGATRARPAPTTVAYLGGAHAGDGCFPGLLLDGLSARGLEVVGDGADPRLSWYLVDGQVEGAPPGLGAPAGELRVVQRLRPARWDRRHLEPLLRFNERSATHTVLPSVGALRLCHRLGYRPRQPMIAHDPPDPRWSRSAPRRSAGTGRRLRLITIVDSRSASRGSTFLRDLDDLPDARFELTVVGWPDDGFRRIRCVAAPSLDERAALFAQHDAYLAADPEAMEWPSLVAALASGLPALYPRHAGLKQVVGLGGLAFTSTGELTQAAQRLADHLELYRRLIVRIELEDVVARYLYLFTGDPALHRHFTAK